MSKLNNYRQKKKKKRKENCIFHLYLISKIELKLVGSKKLPQAF